MPATGVGNTNGAGNILAGNLKVKDAALLVGGDRNLDAVSAALPNLYSVVEPLALARPADSVPIGGIGGRCSMSTGVGPR